MTTRQSVNTKREGKIITLRQFSEVSGVRVCFTLSIIINIVVIIIITIININSRVPEIPKLYKQLYSYINNSEKQN